jgi:hypothetical protein
MKLTAEQAETLTCEDECDGIVVVARQYVRQGRWHDWWNAIIEHPDKPGRYWAFPYSTPLTEYQDWDTFTTDVHLSKEMVPREVTKVVYEVAE